MSEQRLRRVLRQVCDDLDAEQAESPSPGLREAVLPLVLGAGLAVTACDDETSDPGGNDAGTTTSTASGGTGGSGASGGQAGTGGGSAGTGGQGGDVITPYMAPDV